MTTRAFLSLVAHDARRRIEPICERDGFERDLAGACAIASRYLKERLRLVGVESTLVVGTIGWRGLDLANALGLYMRVLRHAWVVTCVDRAEYVVDITASQFHRPGKVYPEAHITTAGRPPYYSAVKDGREAEKEVLFRWDHHASEVGLARLGRLARRHHADARFQETLLGFQREENWRRKSA